DKNAIIVTGAVIDEAVGNDLIVTVIATGLGSLSTKAQPTSISPSKVNDTLERNPLPLSDAARHLIENPPSIEKVADKNREKKKDQDEFLDIPSFVRTQLD
ncbi:MAG: hypothetical protein CMD90_03900, partial [Gammaproteobacteria bacterium]|nr:hypothetical protein [Gammaproteobacteria bacterium]